MITWSVTTYTVDTNTTTADHGAADHRAAAIGDAVDTARRRLTTLTADHWTAPYLSIVIDNHIELMLAVGRHNTTGTPDLTTALAHLDALDAGTHQPGRIF